MKRYLIHTPVFDCRAAALTCGPESLRQHTIKNLKNELGLFRFEQKLKIFKMLAMRLFLLLLTIINFIGKPDMHIYTNYIIRHSLRHARLVNGY